MHIALGARKKGMGQGSRFGRLLIGGNDVHRLAFVALIAGVFMSAPALAQDGADTGYKAMVEVTSHQISVNRGGRGFKQVDGITPVEPGWLVMASASGRGWIIYPDCDVEVLPGRVYTVEDRPGVVQVRDAKEHRPICKKAAPWWIVGAAVPLALCLTDDCFDGDNGPTSP